MFELSDDRRDQLLIWMAMEKMKFDFHPSDLDQENREHYRTTSIDEIASEFETSRGEAYLLKLSGWFDEAFDSPLADLLRFEPRLLKNIVAALELREDLVDADPDSAGSLFPPITYESV